MASGGPQPPAPQASDLVAAFTEALRAAFPERPAPRRRRLPPSAQPFADPTSASDDDDDIVYQNFPASQDPPGRYRANLPDDSDPSSDSEDDDHHRRPGYYPRAIRPHRAPTGTRGQRLFTTQDPPTRRDLRNALLFVDRASRQSRFFGTRDVVELQTLELFLGVWDSVPPLRPSAKLRIFDRVRLLYHVALSGWQSALQGYADPSASYLLGAPLPQPAQSAPADRPSRPTTRGRGTATRGNRGRGNPPRNRDPPDNVE